MEEATHWIALEDENNEFIDVTIGQCYRLLYDKFDEEYIIIDDEGVWSLNYLCHHGYFARLEEKEEYQMKKHNKIVKIVQEMREHKNRKR